MASAPNPYYYDPSVGSAASNIAAAIFGNPDKAANYSNDLAQTDLINQKSADLRHAATARNSVEAALLGFDPKNPNNGDVIRRVASGQAGSGDLSDLNKALLALTANLGGTDEQKVNALVGDGHMLGKDDAVSLAGQEAIRSGNFGQETAIKNSELANALLQNQNNNTRALEERRMMESGEDRRMHVETSPGAVTTLPANSPLGVTTIQGNPTVDTAKGGVMTDIAAGNTPSPLAQALLFNPVNTPAGNITSAVPGDPRIPSGSMNGLPTVDTQKAGIIENAVGAGFGTDPNEIVNPGGALGAAMGVKGKPLNWAAPNGHKGITYDGVTNAADGQPLPEGVQIQNGGSQAAAHYVTNSKGVRVVDGPGVEVGLPGGKPNTPHNYRTPDNKVVLSTDGQTILGHPDQPLPPGTVQVGSMPAAPTEFQGKATGFALAMDGALQGIKQLPPNFDPTNAVLQLTAGTNAPFTATDISAKFQDPQQQRYMRAVTEMLAIILRGDSGAAINPDEFVRYGKIYVPQIGEDPLVMGDKWKALNARKEAYVSQAGGWYEAALQRIAQNPPGDTWGGGGATPAGAAVGAEETKVINGVTYHKVNGQWFSE